MQAPGCGCIGLGIMLVALTVFATGLLFVLPH